MPVPLQITTRDMPHSEALENLVRERAERLARNGADILRLHVVIEAVNRNKQHGKQYDVHIDLTVPGAELAVNRARDEDAYVAVRGAFDAARRQLKAHQQRRRGDVKSHGGPSRS